jgi:single-strand DNA-binding protein
MLYTEYVTRIASRGHSAMSVNKLILIGRMVRDPEMKYTSSGQGVVNASIAVDRFTKNADGEKDCDFFNLVAWRKQAEFMEKYLKKGRLVYVEGRMQSRRYTDNTGNRRQVWECVVDNIQGLDRAKEAGEGTDHTADDDGPDPYQDEAAE